ncbi:MAG: HDOD domain-containing protein [Lachnospiraceae bacterium]|nr:HDOD domain-containing protein [Lachnospiraceae bacterium]
MLATLIPLFDNSMNVPAYSIFVQRENLLANPGLMGTGSLDMASRVFGIEIINNMGLNSVAVDRKVFVEVNNISVYADIENECKANPERIVLLANKSIKPTDQYVNRFFALKQKGFSVAIRGLAYTQFEEYKPLLKVMDYVLLDHKKVNIAVARAYFAQRYPQLKMIAVNVNSREEYEALTEKEGYSLYEGEFFRVPIAAGDKEVSPLKVNYIELLNVVNEPDFDLMDAADVISRDTALVISLLEIVNRLSRNSEITSVRHAAAMLGQKELKKWINTAVTRELCADKPNEITRLSLLRAKFAENLAPLFEKALFSSELFLMGLFSVIDIILDKPMAEALKLVKVSRTIYDALVKKEGEFAPILDFIVNYENASFQEVSRQMLLKDIDDDKVYDAYVQSLIWYKEMFFGR